MMIFLVYTMHLTSCYLAICMDNKLKVKLKVGPVSYNIECVVVIWPTRRYCVQAERSRSRGCISLVQGLESLCCVLL